MVFVGKRCTEKKPQALVEIDGTEKGSGKEALERWREPVFRLVFPLGTEQGLQGRQVRGHGSPDKKPICMCPSAPAPGKHPGYLQTNRVY